MRASTVRIPVRTNLFPFFTPYARQGVMNMTRDSEAAGSDKFNFPIPVPIYMQNVFPTVSGYKSVHFLEANQYGFPAGFPCDFEDPLPDFGYRKWFNSKIIPIQDAGNKIGYVVVLDNGQLYGITGLGAGGNGAYSPQPAFKGYVNFPGLPLDETREINARLTTYAFLKEVTYVFHPALGLFSVNLGSGEITKYEDTGLITSNLLGITTSAGYLVAYTEDQIYRSSTFNPTDFVPTAFNGAGTEIPLYVRGTIVACVSIDSGFIIYSTENMTSASYSGQVDLPFVYKELGGGAGIDGIWNVTSELGQKEHFAWTSAGLQLVSRSAVEPFFADASEFLSSGLLERYVSNVKDWKFTDVVSPGEFNPESLICAREFEEDSLYFPSDQVRKFDVALTFCGKRYLVISYGFRDIQNSNMFALVFDTQMKTWGKLKMVNVSHFFDFQPPSDFSVVEWQDLPGAWSAIPSGVSWKDLANIENRAQDQSKVIGCVSVFSFSQLVRYPDDFYEIPVLQPGGYWPGQFDPGLPVEDANVLFTVVETEWDEPKNLSLEVPYSQSLLVYGYYNPVRGKWLTFHDITMTELGASAAAGTIGSTPFRVISNVSGGPDPYAMHVAYRDDEVPYRTLNKTTKYFLDICSPDIQLAFGKYCFNLSAIECSYSTDGDSF